MQIKQIALAVAAALVAGQAAAAAVTLYALTNTS